MQLGPFPAPAGCFFLKDKLTTGRLQRAELRGRVLISGRDSGVADAHDLGVLASRVQDADNFNLLGQYAVNHDVANDGVEFIKRLRVPANRQHYADFGLRFAA